METKIDNISEFEKSYKRFIEGGISYEEHLIRSLTFTLLSSEDEYEEMLDNYKEKQRELINKKNSGKIKGSIYGEKIKELIRAYRPVWGTKKELRESVSELFEELEDLPEDEVLKKGTSDYSNEEWVGAFYHSYLCYLHLNKDLKGTSAREHVCQNIAEELEDEEKLELWKNELPGAPAETFTKYLN